jgi:hypothetical protein
MTLANHFAVGGHAVAYEHIPIGEKRFYSAIDQIDIFFLDEAQRLGRLQRRRLISAANHNLQLVLSSHEDLAPLFKKKKSPLSTVALANITVEHLSNVLEKRLTYFSLNPNPSLWFSSAAIEFLWRRFGSDLRSVERFLYEFFQQLNVKGEIRVSHIHEMEKLLWVSNQFIIG